MYLIRHLLNVKNYSLSIGISLNLDRKSLEDLEVASLYHDIGKVRIPKEILNKPSKLTHDEMDIMKLHIFYGAIILKNKGFKNNIIRSVLCHHEKYDGTGYLKLNNNNIPLFSKIISIADAYDAMVDRRIYQKKKTKDEAMREIINCSGHQFDPLIVKIFLKNINNGYKIPLENRQNFPSKINFYRR